MPRTVLMTADTVSSVWRYAVGRAWDDGENIGIERTAAAFLSLYDRLIAEKRCPSVIERAATI